MFTKCWPLLIAFVVSCSSSTEFTTEEQTSVVITKNPKGQPGGATETRRVEFNAPWLANSNELQLELRSVILSDASSNRLTVGTTDSRVFLKVTKTTSGAVEFSASPEDLKNAKAIEFEVQSAFVKSNNKNIPILSKSISLSLPYDDTKQVSASKLISAFLLVTYSSAENSCNLSPSLSATTTQSQGSKACGGGGSSSSGDGDDDKDDDDKDDDNDD